MVSKSLLSISKLEGDCHMTFLKNLTSLKGRIVSLFLAVTLILGITSYTVFKYIESKWHHAQLANFEGFSKNLGQAIAAQFFERYGDVQSFALNPVMQSKNHQEIVEALNAYSALYGIYDLILVTDNDGKLVAVNSLGPDGKKIASEALYKSDFSDAPWFQAVMKGKFTEDKAKGFVGTYFEDALIDPSITKVFGEKRIVSGFSSPIRGRDGKTIGVVSNRAGSRWFEGAYQLSLETIKNAGFSQAKISLFGNDGTLIFELGSEKTQNWDRILKYKISEKNGDFVKEMLMGKSGSETHEDTELGTMIVGFSQIKESKFIDSIGWNVTVHEPAKEALAVVNNADTIFKIALGTALILAVAAGFWLASTLSRKLTQISSLLSAGSNEVGTAAAGLSIASTELSTSSNQQASALQETSSAIEEISSMVKRSADLANEAHTSSAESRRKAEEGGNVIERMNQSMDLISKNTDIVAMEMNENNLKVESILKVIQEIAGKTKVINDIVFQTKLLSFNASVEAARAGENGKGFAVVAEEVGNLAHMSGNAAKEINQLLDESQRSVADIINKTKERVVEIVADAKSAVEGGNRVASDCGAILKEIVQTSVGVSDMVEQISQANTESSRGVEEIAKALQQMDQATHVNANSAKSCADSSASLSEQVKSLRTSAGDLDHLINGRVISSKFVWKDAYLLGVNSMDNEHKVLVEKINKFAHALDSGSQASKEFQELAEFTKEHFTHEEKYQTEIDFPQREAHFQIHAQLLKRVGEFGDELKSGKVNHNEIMTFLNDWLLNHILGADMKYARYSRSVKKPKQRLKLAS